MYLRKTIYQMDRQLRKVIPHFHQAHVENLAAMVIGMTFARSVSLPAIAAKAPVKRKQRRHRRHRRPRLPSLRRGIQPESRVQRFERVLKCKKFIPQEVLKPVAEQVLRFLSRWQESVILVMDRSMINDTLNLLHVAVGFEGRAVPLGWVEVPHEGNSDLALQQQLLTWVAECLPRGVEVWIVADREFHSIRLAEWLETRLGWHYALRIKTNTLVATQGRCQPAVNWAVKGMRTFWPKVRVTTDLKVTHRVTLSTLWVSSEDEPWLLISDVADRNRVIEVYAKRFWIEEMFSDHKSRGFDLEVTRITDSNRLQRLLVAVVLAYLWVLEVGAFVIASGHRRWFDNHAKLRSLSICRIGLDYLSHLLDHGESLQLLTLRLLKPVEP